MMMGRGVSEEDAGLGGESGSGGPEVKPAIDA